LLVRAAARQDAMTAAPDEPPSAVMDVEPATLAATSAVDGVATAGCAPDVAPPVDSHPKGESARLTNDTADGATAVPEAPEAMVPTTAVVADAGHAPPPGSGGHQLTARELVDLDDKYGAVELLLVSKRS